MIKRLKEILLNEGYKYICVDDNSYHKCIDNYDIYVFFNLCSNSINISIENKVSNIGINRLFNLKNLHLYYTVDDLSRYFNVTINRMIKSLERESIKKERYYD